MSSKQAAKGALSLRPVFVLVAICCVSGALLGGVHMMTAPIIAAAEEQRAQETYAALVPEASSFEELDCVIVDFPIDQAVKDRCPHTDIIEI